PPSPDRDTHSLPTRRSSDLPSVPGVGALQFVQQSIPLIAPLLQPLSPVLPLLVREPHPAQPPFDPAVDERLKGTLPGAQSRAAKDRKSTRLNSSHVSTSYAV